MLFKSLKVRIYLTLDYVSMNLIYRDKLYVWHAFIPCTIARSAIAAMPPQ